jgi:hypothetical protein
MFINKEIEAIRKVVQEETKKGTFVPNLPDGSIILLPQTEDYYRRLYTQTCCSKKYTHSMIFLFQNTSDLMLNLMIMISYRNRILYSFYFLQMLLIVVLDYS